MVCNANNFILFLIILLVNNEKKELDVANFTKKNKIK